MRRCAGRRRSCWQWDQTLSWQTSVRQTFSGPLQLLCNASSVKFCWILCLCSVYGSAYGLPSLSYVLLNTFCLCECYVYNCGLFHLHWVCSGFVPVLFQLCSGFDPYSVPPWGVQGGQRLPKTISNAKDTSLSMFCLYYVFTPSTVSNVGLCSVGYIPFQCMFNLRNGLCSFFKVLMFWLRSDVVPSSVSLWEIHSGGPKKT